jgi:hypothetical protein
VVNVGVREDDSINCTWIKGKVQVSLIGFPTTTLEQTTVEKQIVTIYVDEVLGAGDCVGCTVKGYIHGAPGWSDVR